MHAPDAGIAESTPTDGPEGPADPGTAPAAEASSVLRADLLRVATAGSVDDGKSTLIGRLLYDSKQVLADQLEQVQAASVRRHGAGAVDQAHQGVVAGLMAPDVVDGLEVVHVDQQQRQRLAPSSGLRGQACGQVAERLA